TNGGASFGQPVQVCDAGGGSEQSYPDIAVAGNDNIYIVWQDNRFGDWDTYFAVSTDDGDSFDANMRVNSNPSPTIDQQFPSVAVNTENAVFVVWQDDRNGDDEIYSARSTNDGDSFQTETKVSDDTDDEDQRYPALAIDDSNNIYVAWEDYRSGSNWDIYLATSNNNGNSFGTNVRVNDNSNDNQRRPLVSVDADDHLHAVWYDTRGVFDYIYYVKSTDNGESFGTDTRVCSASGRAILVPPAIAVNSVMEPCIAWTDSRNGNDDVYFSRGVNNAPSCTIFNPAAGSMVSGAVTVSGTASDSDGNEELVQVEVRIDDGTWNTATGTTTWSYDLSTFTLTNGQHVIYARAYDGALYSDLVDVTIIVANAGGNQAPTVSITSPAANEEITGNYVIEGAASDPDGDTQVELVEIRIDNGSWESAIPVAGQNNWTAWVYYLDFSSLSLGEHTIHARSYDGMIYSTEASVTVTLATSDTNNDVFCISIIIIIILLAALLLLLLMRRKEKPVETYHPVQQQEWQGEYVEPGPEMPPTQP
ncbi:MAG: hypothetical protein KAS67_07450, partial [Thermoplasmata archaeon]|nr:hypothetical protein [Thermoplasmata archaeon]